MKLVDVIEDLERKLEQLWEKSDDTQLLNEIGVLLYQVKDWRNAEMYFQRAYELSPENRDILYNYASLLYLQPYYEKAVPIYKACLELCHDDGETMEKLGDSYYRMGEYALAARMYEQLQTVRKGEL